MLVNTDSISFFLLMKRWVRTYILFWTCFLSPQNRILITLQISRLWNVFLWLVVGGGWSSKKIRGVVELSQAEMTKTNGWRDVLCCWTSKKWLWFMTENHINRNVPCWGPGRKGTTLHFMPHWFLSQDFLSFLELSRVWDHFTLIFIFWKELLHHTALKTPRFLVIL